MIKKRDMKPSLRGLYIQDKELLKTVFQPKTKFTFEIDKSNKVIVITPSNDSKNTVSKRVAKNGEVLSVIDIRDKRVKELLANSNKISVTIEEERIFVSLEDDSVIYELPKDSVPSVFKVREKGFEPLQVALDVVALFSGAGMLDSAFINEGFEIKFAVEKEIDASKTYLMNHGSQIFNGDIRTIPKHELPKASVIIGGTPCQAFSNANRVDRVIDHPNNMLVLEYIEAVKANENCKVFVIENVPEILTAGEGRFLEEIKEELADFEITSGVLTATHFDDPQERRRAFIIGSKIGKIELPKPVVKTFKTVGEALRGLVKGQINQDDVTIPKADTERRMSFVQQGGNWKDIPQEFLTEGFGEKTHSNRYRRLAVDKPCITLPNINKATIVHPFENRILSIRECARLFSLPDEFHFVGKLTAMQQQVCNGVPFKLGCAVANTVKKAIEKFNQKQAMYSF